MQNQSSSKEIINKARQEILVGKNPENALKLIFEAEEIFKKDSEDAEFDRNLFSLTLALAYQEKNEFATAAKFYRDADGYYQAGFCELLTGNKIEAEKLWNNCAPSPALEWGKCLLDFVNLKPNPRVPSYLQIRNFLEMDISYFIRANKLSYAENIIKNDELFISINLESHKLIGRALLNNGFLNMAKKFLLKSLKIIDEDSENYYHMAQYYYAVGAYQDCTKMLETCIDLNSNYIPAIELLDKTHLKAASL